MLTLGYTPTATYAVLPRAIQRFRKRHPETRLELIELRSADQADALRAGRIELGFVCGPMGAPDLLERVVQRERPVVALPQRHLLSSRRTVDVRALRDQPFVLVRREVEPAWADPCAHALHALGVGQQVAQETDTKLAMLGLVAARMGVCVVSESMAKIGRQGVVFRPLRGLSLRFVLSALSRPRPSPRVKNFLSML